MRFADADKKTAADARPGNNSEGSNHHKAEAESRNQIWQRHVADMRVEVFV